ncbi:MAG: DUF3352 domain-containing protein [Spirochaetes bacterium]|nr:DUF3352 domain-containing protein [Spirochaetota bacterium]
MKIKTVTRIFLIVFLIAVLGFASYFIYFKLTETEEGSFISSDFMYILQTRNLFKLFDKLNDSQLLDTVFFNKEMKNFYEILFNVRSQVSKTKKSYINFIDFPATVVIQADKRPLVLFNTGLITPLVNITSLALRKLFSDSEDFSFRSGNYNGYKVIKVTYLPKRESFYFTHVKNVLIAAMDKSTVLRSIDTYISKNNLLENENYLQVRSQIGSGGMLWAYFNMAFILKDIKESNKALYESLKTLSILSIAGMDLDLDEGSVYIKGFYSTGLQDADIMKLFLSSPKMVDALEVLPENTDSFVTLTFDNFSDVWRYYKRILSLTGQKEKRQKLVQTEDAIKTLLNLSLEELLFSWLDDEITVSSVSGFDESLTVISIKNIQGLNDLIKKLQKKNILKNFSSEKYKGSEIFHIQLSSFFQFLSDVISSDLELPFYTVHDNFIFLSSNKKLLQFALDSIEKDKLLYYKDDVKKIYSKIRKGNFLTYWDLSRKSPLLLKEKNIFTRIITKYRLGMLTMEFSDKGIKNRIVVTDPIAEKIKLVDGWPIEVDSTIWSTPLVYNVDNKGLDEIIIGTEDGKIYLVDFFGETRLNWPVKVEGNLTTSPFIIPSEFNEILIGAAASSGKVYAWGGDAVMKENFPIQIQGRPGPSVIVSDIDNDKNAEIILSDHDGRIFSFRNNGTTMPGFPVQLKEKAVSDIFLLPSDTSQGKDILCSMRSDNGYIYFINNTGTVNEENVFAAGTSRNASTIVSFLKPSLLSIIQLTSDGKLFVRKKDGSFLSGFPMDLDRKFVNPPATGDLNRDGKKEIIVLSSDGMLSLIDPDSGNIFFDEDLGFKPVENEPILLFDIDKDGKEEIIVPDVKDYIRFYDSRGTLKFKLNGSTTPFIKDMDRDGTYEVITAGYDRKVYLYSIPSGI